MRPSSRRFPLLLAAGSTIRHPSTRPRTAPSGPSCPRSSAETESRKRPRSAECASETGAAKSIAKAALQARSGIANGRKPKCTDTLVGVIDAAATSGCLLATHDTAVDELLEAYGH